MHSNPPRLSNYKAIILGMDGVTPDSEPLHEKTQRAGLQRSASQFHKFPARHSLV